MSRIMLQNMIEDNLPTFSKNQQDREAFYMAAFTSKDIIGGDYTWI
ncbi:hypothetical protein K6959_18190 [Bacillus aquiflavi]|nr:hypothetical protein [Bacillus aquiflavi]UAC48395.1 hypothetical protein K6959_18190 [Bacillus aquiflavi]